MTTPAARGLRTWSISGTGRRRPSEYEVVTRNCCASPAWTPRGAMPARPPSRCTRLRNGPKTCPFWTHGSRNGGPPPSARRAPCRRSCHELPLSLLVSAGGPVHSSSVKSRGYRVNSTITVNEGRWIGQRGGPLPRRRGCLAGLASTPPAGVASTSAPSPQPPPGRVMRASSNDPMRKDWRMHFPRQRRCRRERGTAAAGRW